MRSFGSRIWFAGALAAAVFALGACDSKSGDTDKSGDQEESATAEKGGEKEGAAAEEGPTAEERLEVLKDEAVDAAREEITAKNAEQVASDLEQKLDSEVEGQ